MRPRVWEIDRLHSGSDNVGGPGRRNGGTKRTPGAKSERARRARILQSRKDSEAAASRKAANRIRSFHSNRSRALAASSSGTRSANRTNISTVHLADMFRLEKTGIFGGYESIPCRREVLRIRPSLIPEAKMPPFLRMGGEIFVTHRPIQHPPVFSGLRLGKSDPVIRNRFEMPQMGPFGDVVEYGTHFKSRPVPRPP